MAFLSALGLLIGVLFCGTAGAQEKTPPAPAAPDAKSLGEFWREPGVSGEPKVYPDCPEAAADEAAVKALADQWDRRRATEADWSKLYETLKSVAQQKKEGGGIGLRAVNAARLLAHLHKIHGDAKEREQAELEFIRMAIEAEGKTVGAHRVVMEFNRRIYYGDAEGLDAARKFLLEQTSPDDLAPYDLYRAAELAMIGKTREEDSKKAAREAEPLCRAFLRRFPDHPRTATVKILLAKDLATMGRRQEEVQLLEALVDAGQGGREAKAFLVVAYDNLLLRDEFKTREQMQAACDRIQKISEQMSGDNPELRKMIARILVRFEDRLDQPETPPDK